MITCEYCDSQIKGVRFCSAKHKMAYVRAHQDLYIKNKKEMLPKSNVTSLLPKSNKPVTKRNEVATFHPVPKPGGK